MVPGLALHCGWAGATHPSPWAPVAWNLEQRERGKVTVWPVPSCLRALASLSPGAACGLQGLLSWRGGRGSRRGQIRAAGKAAPPPKWH